MEIVTPTIDEEFKPAMVLGETQQNMNGVPSVLYDAVAVLLSEAGASQHGTILFRQPLNKRLGVLHYKKAGDVVGASAKQKSDGAKPVEMANRRTGDVGPVPVEQKTAGYLRQVQKEHQ